MRRRRFRVCDAADLKRARLPYAIRWLKYATRDTLARIDLELRMATREFPYGLYDRYRPAVELAAFRDAVFARAHWCRTHGSPLTVADAAALRSYDAAVKQAALLHDRSLRLRGSRVTLARAQEFTARMRAQTQEARVHERPAHRSRRAA